eukprot:TRINITY_DN766_c0_g4_i1.p1 TRINITY_DN766_c0_g4~~TRINITY_DN766_c0_g4_i1.p1  ORF type:complete len:302 (-),score=137.76 TRINITY_DN766_c0_g4_i1:157-1062(-)
MADAPSLGDFFAKKKTKKIKATNLNTATTGKEEPKKEDKKKKAEEEEGWQEEEVVQATMKVEAAGKLIREEEKVEEQDNSAPAWGNVKTKDNQSLNDKRFPTLAKSVASSAINLEDKSGQINISTSKNKFANLEDSDDEEEGPKRPKEIKPALVSKKKGERATDAIQKEVGKYKDDKKKESKAAAADDDDEDEDDEEDAKEVKKEVKPKKKASKSKEVASSKGDEESAEAADDVKIEPDLTAAKAKYAHRRKMEKKPLPPEELEAEKENKPAQKASGGGKKKKFANFEEEDTGKKLQYWED